MKHGGFFGVRVLSGPLKGRVKIVKYILKLLKLSQIYGTFQPGEVQPPQQNTGFRIVFFLDFPRKGGTL